MSILSVDQIQPIGSGTTVTLNATEVKTGTEITVGTGASIFSPAGNTLTLGTNNNERIRIKNDGKVGIGTNNPTAKLEIKGSDNPLVKIVQDTSGIARLNLESATNDGYQYSGIGLGDGTNDAELMWTTQGFDINVGNSVRFRILSNGHIAIGHDIANDTGMFKVEAADGQADDQYVGQFKNHEATASRNYGLLVQAGSNSTDHGLRVRNGANNATHLEVRGDGVTTKPLQPGFGASNMNGFTNLSGSTYAVTSYGTVHHNYGNHFNSSNGRFTAPVDGRYFMHAIGMGVNTSSPHIAFGINNSSNGGGPSRGGTDYGNNNVWSHPTDSGYWVCITHIFDLSANDYVRVYTYDWNSSNDPVRCYFYGYLLG